MANYHDKAFAFQAAAIIWELWLDINKGNANGEGHPVGSAGARMVITLIPEIICWQERYGIATLCGGGGQGVARMIEVTKKRKGVYWKSIYNILEGFFDITYNTKKRRILLGTRH
ncbi:hypothetical protein ACH0BF_18105 [Pseudobacillus sp. 179-B 2D1 NHS]